MRKRERMAREMTGLSGVVVTLKDRLNLRVMASLLRAKGPIHGIPEGWQLVAGGKRGTSDTPGSCRKETMRTGGVPAA